MLQTKKQNAFTMIEILVVVFIIGVLATLIGPRVVKWMAKGKIAATKATMATLKGALIEYSQDMGRFPSKRDGGLDALVERPNVKGAEKWDGPYVEGGEVPLDQWGNEFEYYAPPERFKNKYRYFEIIADIEEEDQVLDQGS